MADHSGDFLCLQGLSQLAPVLTVAAICTAGRSGAPPCTQASQRAPQPLPTRGGIISPPLESGGSHGLGLASTTCGWDMTTKDFCLCPAVCLLPAPMDNDRLTYRHIHGQNHCRPDMSQALASAHSAGSLSSPHGSLSTPNPCHSWPSEKQTPRQD